LVRGQTKVFLVHLPSVSLLLTFTLFSLPLNHITIFPSHSWSSSSPSNFLIPGICLLCNPSFSHSFHPTSFLKLSLFFLLSRHSLLFTCLILSLSYVFSPKFLHIFVLSRVVFPQLVKQQK